jgi:hypothetical protein
MTKQERLLEAFQNGEELTAKQIHHVLVLRTQQQP